jgi:hypothetical protein
MVSSDDNEDDEANRESPMQERNKVPVATITLLHEHCHYLSLRFLHSRVLCLFLPDGD